MMNGRTWIGLGAAIGISLSLAVLFSLLFPSRRNSANTNSATGASASLAPVHGRRWWATLGRAASGFMRLAVGLVMTVVLVIMALAFVPRLLGNPAMVVLGDSMGRSMPIGSLAFTEEISASEVSTGDVIVIGTEVSGRVLPMTHRVVNTENQGDQRTFQTKGDANDAVDPEVAVIAEDAAVPRVVSHLPYAGYLAGFIQTPLGWSLLVLLPGAFVTMSMLVSILTDKGSQSSVKTPGPIGWLRWAF